MSENKNRIQQSDKIVDIVEKILEFNGQNQEGQGLKILTPKQMLSRLPLSLAQLKARNSSGKLIIRQYYICIVQKINQKNL